MASLTSLFKGGSGSHLVEKTHAVASELPLKIHSWHFVDCQDGGGGGLFCASVSGSEKGSYQHLKQCTTAANQWPVWCVVGIRDWLIIAIVNNIGFMMISIGRFFSTAKPF